MTVEPATSAVEPPAISVDRNTTYRVNAGRCDHCGNFKTWDFKVKSPASGKMMPGHVTVEGYKIDDGYCPYWEAVKRDRPKNREPTAAAPQSKQGGTARPRPPLAQGAGDPLPMAGTGMEVSARGDEVIISGGPGVAITLGRREAVVLARDILTAVVG